MSPNPDEVHDLIYDWNLVEESPRPKKRVMIVDETLRDGLQSPSIIHPEIEDKVYLLYLMRDLGIDAADLGLCGAGEKFKYHVTVLAREIVNQKMPIQPQSAARSIEADIAPIVDASQQAGIPIEACIFLGTSPIRQYAEGWELDFLLKQAEESVTFAVKHGIPVMFVTEDTIRAKPETLKQVYSVAIRAGAHRICVSDTVGHIAPNGTRSLISYLRKTVDEINPEVGIDWHGHKDRGLDIANTLAAIEAGADRVHACGLGIGERSGNTPMELLLVNLNLLGWANRDLSKIPEYCKVISEKCGATIPFNYPVVGADAFRTATGVHAAAIAKADRMDDAWLAERVYCGVPASMVGREHTIEIGPMAGEHNVRFFLRKHGIEEHPVYVEKILAAAKRSNRLLSEDDVRRMVRVLHERLSAGGQVEDSELDAAVKAAS
ncbi:MAG: 2-isopropylmalate synthase [Chloroflexi bacterium]|nr:Homocitrate synthase [Anaerolineales bacterium]MCE7919493.1 2-isopropylmalate synthase [Chloroflexi bacterium CFX1]MCQ3952830.1 2-isopropylmalate synthase [Chloroflexota bacterium]MDL1917869.1 2-isopropylmalate synthase [Chloroflexi bacterium CFX5]MCK6568644.1 LeuA family protein [Anaerolineales bacterium]